VSPRDYLADKGSLFSREISAIRHRRNSLFIEDTKDYPLKIINTRAARLSLEFRRDESRSFTLQSAEATLRGINKPQ